eukprot:1196021-Prorocentrum_minimum.AAC.1
MAAELSQQQFFNAEGTSLAEVSDQKAKGDFNITRSYTPTHVTFVRSLHTIPRVSVFPCLAST